MLGNGIPGMLFALAWSVVDVDHSQAEWDATCEPLPLHPSSLAAIVNVDFEEGLLY